MQLTTLKANMTELTLNGGLTILFSYKTPVACFWTNGMGSRVYYKTAKKWSATTTRHINQWLVLTDSSGYLTVETRPQEYFDNFIAEVK